jgi:carboxypeptidase PM20D1
MQKCKHMRLVSILISSAALIITGVVLLRAASIPSRQITVDPVAPIALDMTQAASRLAGAIAYRTISHQDQAKRDDPEILRFHQYLEQAFPRVHATITRETVNNYSLLYTWKGTETELDPVLLMAHMDVVPAESVKEGDWTYPPFAGRISDGYIWGRGSMDVKLAITAPLEAIDRLIEEGFRPRRTVYIAIGHDEETGGWDGAAKIASLLEERGVQLAFTLDEGSAIVKGIVPGLSQPVALVALAEKGYLTLMLTATGEGGHSSRPVHLTAIGKLARAIYRLESDLMPAELREPAAGIFEYLASEMPFGMRIVISNRWLFEPVLMTRLEGLPATNAIIRTTTAPTMLPETGTKENVIPRQATAVVNFRILPGDTVQTVMDHVIQAIDDSDVSVTRLNRSIEASPVSDHESTEFQTLHKTIRQIFPETLVAPSLVAGATDSRHYVNIARNSFRFLPMRLEKQDLKRIHGNDERIGIENYGEIIQFYIQLLRNSVAE